MRILTPLRHGAVALLFIALLLLAPLASAQWTATVGGENKSMGRQALAFLPNEIWIHAGDNVTWTLNTDEPHTITFLTPTDPAVVCGGLPGILGKPGDIRRDNLRDFECSVQWSGIDSDLPDGGKFPRRLPAA